MTGLRVLEAVLRNGSLSAAARELCVTPAAISHRLRSLEAQGKAALVRRDGAILLVASFLLSDWVLTSFLLSVWVQGLICHLLLDCLAGSCRARDPGCPRDRGKFEPRVCG